jgi:hypothetical protein
VRIASGAVGGSTTLSVAVPGSAQWQSFSVSATIQARNLEGSDSCSFEVSADGGVTWGPGPAALISLQDGQELVHYSATAVVSKPGPASLMLRLRLVSSDNVDYCLLHQVLVMAASPYTAACGNGFVDAPTEQCDCGSSDCSAIDSACDGSTCLAATTTTTTTTITTTTTTTPSVLLSVGNPMAGVADVSAWTFATTSALSGASLTFLGSQGSVRINPSAERSTTTLSLAVPSSAQFSNFAVSATIQAINVEANDFCSFEVSTDGGLTWQSQAVVMLSDGQENAFYSASALISKPSAAVPLVVRLKLLGNAVADYCLLQQATVSAWGPI